ncbi:MAG: PAS domain S-box protein [Candidatus Cloacimonetes bacterium]|nr:PAS domain S-box protein [Candidatus Cloacimonadota bacterium]
MFLNELRHKKDTALKLKLDIDKSHDVSATMAVTGKEGIIHGIDYRGEPVMSALRKVKNTPWFMVVEIDRSEVFKPFYSKILTFGIGILLLMLSATMAVVFIERNRDANWLSLHLALEREKSKLQEEYKAIAKEWETSFSSINEMIWILDKEMKVVRANRPLNPALELTPEELVGNQCWKIVHGSDEPVPECPYLLMRQSNKRATAEFKLDSKWIEVTIDPILDDNNELMGAVHIINDITERKTADEIIRKSQNLLQKIIDSAPFGAHTYQLTDDDKLIFIAANTSANLILGFDHSPLLGKELLEAFPGNAGTEIPDAYRMVARTGKSYDNELIEYHEGVINGAFEVHALQTGDNMMTAFFQDITQRKQAEEIVQRSHDVLEQLVKQRTKELENAIMELESFSYSVSHDLRAPLRGIDGWNHALVEDCEHLLDDTAKKYIEHIHLETRRMGQLIDDLLKLAHVSKREFTIEKVSLSTLAVSIMTRLRTEDKTRKADIKISPDIFAFGDRNLLETALTNLLDNAWKFTGKNEMTEIEFGTVQKENKRVFFVKDNGAGFDMQYKGKLFGAFQRLHNPTEFPGTGIGLATVQRIIHRHRGEIWAEAKPNQGATFYFTLEEQL